MHLHTSKDTLHKSGASKVSTIRAFWQRNGDLQIWWAWSFYQTKWCEVFTYPHCQSVVSFRALIATITLNIQFSKPLTSFGFNLLMINFSRIYTLLMRIQLDIHRWRVPIFTSYWLVWVLALTLMSWAIVEA